MIQFGQFKKYSKDILAALKGERVKIHNGELYLFNDSMRLLGTVVEGVNGGDWREHKNLICDQGIRYVLNASLGSGTTTRLTAFYLAPFSGSTSPVAAWTAANFTSNSTEITATTPEGFSEATRQAATLPDTTANNYIDNYAAKAAWTTVTASSLSVTGLGLLSSATRGGTAGTLIGATKFATARSLQSGDTWSTGWRYTLAGT